MKSKIKKKSPDIFLSDTIILKELKSLLDKKYPELIEKIILFGSRAKGIAEEFSDYDILIILKTNYNWELEKKIQNTCWEVDYKYDILTDVKIISKNELKMLRGKQLYILNAIEEGVAV